MMGLSFRAPAQALAVCLALAGAAAACAQARPLEIEYASPRAAYEALRSKEGIEFQKDDSGWTVAVDRASAITWSFSPNGDPSFPAVVKRQLREVDGRIVIAMRIMCGGSKSACDTLASKYEEVNERIARDARSQLAGTQGSEAAGGPAGVVHAVAASNRDKAWQPTPAQRERVVKDASSYLTARDQGRLADAYAHFSPDQKSAVPFEKWELDKRQFHGSAGASAGRVLRKVTWYKDPPNAPAGVYAAVDFVSQFSGLHLHCGYVAVQEQSDGRFLVAREEENSISKAQAEKLSPEAMRKVREAFRC